MGHFRHRKHNESNEMTGAEGNSTRSKEENSQIHHHTGSRGQRYGFFAFIRKNFGESGTILDLKNSQIFTMLSIRHNV